VRDYTGTEHSEKRMKASVLTNYGSPDFFKLTEVEQPAPGDDEVLVKVVAASIYVH
jgi:NADPH:quinone reductase-like Zn-dependent oxidoreductase